MKVGKGTLILSNVFETFGSEPWLVELGDNVEITANVKFITHDGSVWVIRNKESRNEIDVFGKITVGNNCFFGMNSIILPGVTIGDNCVIGAGAIVTRDIPDNTIVGGVPAKNIKTYDEYRLSMLNKAVPTKNMSIGEKKQYLKEKYPEWNIE